MNLVVRKRETERIERENHAFAKRLFDKKAIVEKKKLEKDYGDHLKYKRQIQKMPGMGGKGRQRAATRGAAAATGMSHGQLMGEQYPQAPSHFLGEAPLNLIAASDGQI